MSRGEQRVALVAGFATLAVTLDSAMRNVGVILGAGTTTLVFTVRLGAHRAAGLESAAANAGALADSFMVAAAVAMVAALVSLAPRRAP